MLGVVDIVITMKALSLRSRPDGKCDGRAELRCAHTSARFVSVLKIQLAMPGLRSGEHTQEFVSRLDRKWSQTRCQVLFPATDKA